MKKKKILDINDQIKMLKAEQDYLLDSLKFNLDNDDVEESSNDKLRLEEIHLELEELNKK